MQSSDYETLSDQKYAQAKRVPPQAAQKGLEIAETALDKQLEIMAEQQKKGDEFVNKEVSAQSDVRHAACISEGCSFALFITHAPGR